MVIRVAVAAALVYLTTLSTITSTSAFTVTNPFVDKVATIMVSSATRRFAQAARICPEVPLQPSTRNSEIAIVALGWFWHPQPVFQALRGVKRCIVGYTGGVQEQPTYQNIADYTEALLIEFDSTETSIDVILEEWRKQTSPYKTKCQYRTALWYLSEKQEAQMKKMANTMSGGKFVDVEPATQFFMAEEYHQNFIAKQTGSFARA